MESPERSAELLRLGKRIAFQLSETDDLLAHWMAHDIAERMLAFEAQAEPEAKQRAGDACAKAILELWAHRRNWPGGSNPLEELDPIARAIASLDTKRDAARYFSSVFHEARADPESAVSKWLGLAAGLDASARELIGDALRRAVAEVSPSSRAWVELAAVATSEEPLELRLFKRALDPLSETERSNEALRKQSERLEAFAAAASQRAAELRAEMIDDELASSTEPGLERNDPPSS